MIDTDVLKNKILELAFQGRLSERLSTDSDVNLIIEACEKDKRVSIAEGKYKNENFSGTIENKSIPNCITPKSWAWMRISDMSLFQEGPGILAVDFRTSGIPLIRIAGMNGDVVELTGCNYLDPDMVEDKWKHFKLDKGDIVISSSASLDRIAEVDEQAEGSIPYTGLIRFKMYGGINKEYFKWFIKSPYYMGQVDKQKQGGFIQHYGPSHLRKMIIPIPSKEEQERIVNKLNELFEQINIIDSLQQQYESDLSVLKGKIIDAGIRGKLTKQLSEDGDAETLYAKILEEKAKLIKEGKIKKEKPLPEIKADEVPFEIPKNWKWVRIANIGLTVTGTTPPKTDAENYGGAYQFFKPSDLDLGRHISAGSESLTEEGWKVSRQLEKGTILVCCIGSIGKCAIIDVDGTTNQQINALTPIICDSDYLLYAINSDSFQNQLQQGSRATTVTIIKKSKFDECIIPLPPIKEQKRIAVKIDEMLCMMKLCQR